MKIALVQGPAWHTDSPPYGIAMLNTVLTERGHTVTCFDFNIELYHKKNAATNLPAWDWQTIEQNWAAPEIEEIIRNNQALLEECLKNITDCSPEVIGFSVQTTSKAFSLELAKKIKKQYPHIIILYGGSLCSRIHGGLQLYKENPCIDILSLCESEHSIGNVMTHIAAKNINTNIPGYLTRTKDGRIIDGKEYYNTTGHLPYADYSQFDLAKYPRQTLPLLTSRGCINRCTFCIENIFGGPYRTRAVEEVSREIAYQNNRHPGRFKNIWFVDSLMNGDIPHFVSLCHSLKDNAIPWFSELLIRKELTSAIMNLAKKSGCHGLVYGLESGSNKILSCMGKGYTKEHAIRVIEDTHNAGITIYLNIIVGFPQENIFDFLETLLTIKTIKKHIAAMNFSLCSIPPGCILYKNRDRLRLSISDNNVQEWSLKNGGNTLPIRLERLRISQKLFANSFPTVSYSNILVCFIPHLYTIIKSRLSALLLQRKAFL